MQQIDAAVGRKANRVMAHWVIRTCRNHSGQINALGFIARADIGRRRPGWVGAFIRNGGHHRRRQGVAAQLTNPDGINRHFTFTRRVIIEAQLGEVNHQAFARCIRQQRLQRDGQDAAGARYVRVDTRVGL
ncbi:hypothetical protein D3C71_1705320 [compost metagenome]